MEILKNKTYIFVFNINNKFLTYTGTVIDVDDDFITFVDKFDSTFTYSIKTIISMEAIKND